MLVRLLGPEDAEAYQTIRLRALKDHPDAFAVSYEEELQNTVETYKTRFQSQEAFTFGAFKDNALVGTVTLVQQKRVKLSHKADIVAMYVDPVSRGQGLGKILIKEAIRKAKHLKNIEQLNLTVLHTNEPAKQLYSSMGFEVFGTERRSLKVNGQYLDEQHMVLYLY